MLIKEILQKLYYNREIACAIYCGEFLENVRLVSKTRNIFYFTGEYKGKTISVGASGMGCASIGIYSYELYTEYDVDTIIRIGTCGAYTTI